MTIPVHMFNTVQLYMLHLTMLPDLCQLCDTEQMNSFKELLLITEEPRCLQLG